MGFSLSCIALHRRDDAPYLLRCLDEVCIGEVGVARRRLVSAVTEQSTD